MKRKKRLVRRSIYYNDPEAVANRIALIAAILVITFLAGMAAGSKADVYADSVSMQPVKKAEWAVEYSKENGEYPFQ